MTTHRNTHSNPRPRSLMNVRLRQCFPFPVCKQPRTQTLSTTRLAGGKTLVQTGHVSPRFWEITIGTYGGREGKCGVRVENNTRSVNKARQRATMKQSIYWHVFFIKYVQRLL
jgi:hypothetical protein